MSNQRAQANKTHDANRTELDNQGRSIDISVVGDHIKTAYDKELKKVVDCQSEMKFFKHQFNQQGFYKGSKKEWKEMMSSKLDGDEGVDLTIAQGFVGIENLKKILDEQ